LSPEYSVLSKLALLWVEPEPEPKPKMGMEVVWVISDSQSEHVLEVRRLSFEVEGKSEKWFVLDVTINGLR
jgi:hypothetical protein